VRLFLHNNTRWTIESISVYEPFIEGGQVRYTIELEDGCREKRLYSDVVLGMRLLPGKAISFVVPQEDFPKGSQIYVTFNYSWELSEGIPHGNEAVHRAYFRANDLPEWPKDE
jgi:hypothetical protein